MCLGLLFTETGGTDSPLVEVGELQRDGNAGCYPCERRGGCFFVMHAGITADRNRQVHIRIPFAPGNLQGTGSDFLILEGGHQVGTILHGIREQIRHYEIAGRYAQAGLRLKKSVMRKRTGQQVQVGESILQLGIGL